MFETIGLVLVLAVIVWMTYRYYGTPESEYQKVLDRLSVNDFSHLETDAIKERISEAQQTLKEMDEEMAKSQKKKHKKSRYLHHRLESIKLSLLIYELHKRECEQSVKSGKVQRDNDKINE